jgi:hypothetical protein
MTRPRDSNRVSIAFYVTPALKAELETEAWEEQLSLSHYIRGLLTRRGKWARSVRRAGGYDLQCELPPSKRGDDNT